MLITKNTYKDKLLDPRWQKRRLEIFQRDEFTCQICMSKTKTLHVHHFCYDAGGNPWDVDESALITYCEDCHEVASLDNLSPVEQELIQFLTGLRGSMFKNPAYFQHCIEYINSVILKHKRNG